VGRPEIPLPVELLVKPILGKTQRWDKTWHSI
jgi:hypothetical protein